MNLFDELAARHNQLPEDEKERLAEAAKQQSKSQASRNLIRCDTDEDYNADQYDKRAKWHEPDYHADTIHMQEDDDDDQRTD